MRCLVLVGLIGISLLATPTMPSVTCDESLPTPTWTPPYQEWLDQYRACHSGAPWPGFCDGIIQPFQA